MDFIVCIVFKALVFRLLKPEEELTNMTSSMLLELTTVFKFVNERPSMLTKSFEPI